MREKLDRKARAQNYAKIVREMHQVEPSFNPSPAKKRSPVRREKSSPDQEAVGFKNYTNERFNMPEEHKSPYQAPALESPRKSPGSFDTKSASYIQNQLSIAGAGMDTRSQPPKDGDDEVISAIERRLEMLEKIR